MKKAVLYYKDTDNIGDDIQTLAAQRLIGPPDQYLDREALSDYKGNLIKLLCNGYFMVNPTKWPPSKNIDPLLVSFHISNYYGCEEHMLAPSLKEYYNQHGPVGCRDRDTMQRLQAIGVDAYYSGCLTLTLKPKEELEKSGEILLVDPFLKVYDQKYEDHLISKIVPQEYMSKVSVVRHEMPLKHLSIQERLRIAENLLDRYQRAHLIITSRIHCALPCLALGTPVYFMDVGYDRKGARKRFDGILDYMNVIGQEHIGFSSSRPSHKLLRKLQLYQYGSSIKKPLAINWESPSNPTSGVRELAENIRNTVLQSFNLLS